MSWNDEHCSSRYTVSLIGQYLDKIVSKFNRASSCVFMKVLALLWYGRQFLEIISSFFSPIKIGVFFLHSQISSRYTLSLIGQYLDKIVIKFNRASSYVFMKFLAHLWCGRQFPEIISSFFLSSPNLGFLFVTSNCTDGFMRISNKEMKFETNVVAILT
jgi:hypothetical protein